MQPPTISFTKIREMGPVHCRVWLSARHPPIDRRTNLVHQRLISNRIEWHLLMRGSLWSSRPGLGRLSFLFTGITWVDMRSHAQSLMPRIGACVRRAPLTSRSPRTRSIHQTPLAGSCVSQISSTERLMSPLALLDQSSKNRRTRARLSPSPMAT